MEYRLAPSRVGLVIGALGLLAVLAGAFVMLLGGAVCSPRTGCPGGIDYLLGSDVDVARQQFWIALGYVGLASVVGASLRAGWVAPVAGVVVVLGVWVWIARMTLGAVGLPGLVLLAVALPFLVAGRWGGPDGGHPDAERA